MTYPPPPGVPGDPGQQPMSDPYAQGGGYGPPPSDPYAQGGGYPPPPSDPYGAPSPQYDPYGQPPPPPQDPYGQPPMSGVPMSPGMSGPQYGPPPQDPYGQPPSFLGGGQPPPPKKNNIGWILGGVGGAAVLVILVVVGLIVFTSSSDDSAGGGTDDPSSDQPSADDSGEPSEDDGGGEGTYEVTEGMCDQIDVAAIPASLGVDKLDQIDMQQGEMYCSSMSTSTITIKAKAFDDEKEAEEGYEKYKDDEIIGGDGLKSFDGNWDKGEISQYESLDGTASALILDGNMAISIFISATDDATNDEAKEGATAMAEGALSAAS